MKNGDEWGVEGVEGGGGGWGNLLSRCRSAVSRVIDDSVETWPFHRVVAPLFSVAVYFEVNISLLECLRSRARGVVSVESWQTTEMQTQVGRPRGKKKKT